MIKLKSLIQKLAYKFGIIIKLENATAFSENKFQNRSWSQEGEDLLLARFFENEKNGFYIDVGAHHPFRFSNTYKFYKMGWRGVNIEPMENSQELFSKFRPRDEFVNCGVSSSAGVLNYYEYSETALNTFSYDRFKFLSEKECWPIKESQIQVKTLTEILDSFPELLNLDISFITIDVEGKDFEVLKSLDLKKYSPKFILIESNNREYSDEVTEYLETFNYNIIAKLYNTVIYSIYF
jgi:FkbM family methyltransferase